MIRGREALALLAVGLMASAGCAQALGLGDYGPQEDAGADDGSSGDGTVATDSGQGGDTTTDSPGTNDTGTTDTGTPDAHGDSPHDGGGPDAPTSDAGTGDAHPADAGNASDAMVDSPVFAADACSGANACAPAAPSGWTGPLALWEGTGTPPSCAAFYLDAFEGGTVPQGSAASCGCTCGSVSGSNCGPATIQFATGLCDAGCSTAISVAPNACTNVTSQTTTCGMGTSIKVTGSIADGGGCQPTATTNAQAPTWANLAFACQPSQQTTMGCSANQVCVPSAGSPFESTFCVMKAGSNSCPSPFTTQKLFYTDITDTRGCSACSCGAANGVDCNANAHVTTWSNSSCNAGKGSDLSPLPLGCSAVGSSHYLLLTTSPTGGSCTPSGGTPTGGVAPANLTTICCL